MDLITKLPPGEHGFDAIAVFVDRLSKMVHFVPCRESMNAEAFARLFIDNVFKHHGVPREIISDRGSHFTNHFWASIMTILGVKECKSSAYHPESDGQTERYNRTLEEMLRHYISPAQSDWPFFLSLAEFAVNNSWQESIQSTPFLVNTGQSPLTPALLELPGEVYCPTARRLSEWWQSNVKQARHFMELAQRRQAHLANKGRKEVEYHTGQLVLLSTKNLRMKPGKAKKLLPRFIGPFKVLEHVGPVAVRLDLPQAMARMHPVFHVSLLRPYTSEHPHLPPPVEWLDEAPLYEVEKLLAHRGVRAGKARGYLVKWQGYDDSYNTWEPRNNLVNC
ncbi:DDE-type integrase/transposase/recombinase, partial [Bosea sp. (in: a-proteobacteria)]|uniref:DDE-type integrase/transposase/recombinase n=1 Tax=Bosea sp. (in: a-proteobacteria) TaxID=1871050 RepID=UPI00403461CA